MAESGVVTPAGNPMRTAGRADAAAAAVGDAAVGDAAAAGESAMFLDRFLRDVSGASVCVMCAIGDRLGLFRLLAATGPATSAQLAAAGGLDERYLREWLWALASAGYLRADGENGTFHLPPAHAAALAAEDSPFFMAGVSRLLPALSAMLDKVVDAFRSGAGLDPDEYPPDLYRTMWRMSSTWLDRMLVPLWIPAVDGLRERLLAGIRVAHLSSGNGRALVLLAQAFPRSVFVGFDRHGGNVTQARTAASAARVADRVSFERGDAVDVLAEGFGLVLALDVLHDALDLDATLRAIRRAVGTDGVFLLLETDCRERPVDNVGPAASLFYATSTLYSIPLARSAGGEALGMMGLPEGVLRDACAAAGFRSFRTLMHPIPSFNTLYEIRA